MRKPQSDDYYGHYKSLLSEPRTAHEVRRERRPRQLAAPSQLALAQIVHLERRSWLRWPNIQL